MTAATLTPTAGTIMASATRAWTSGGTVANGDNYFDPTVCSVGGGAFAVVAGHSTYTNTSGLSDAGSSQARVWGVSGGVTSSPATTTTLDWQDTLGVAEGAGEGYAIGVGSSFDPLYQVHFATTGGTPVLTEATLSGLGLSSAPAMPGVVLAGNALWVTSTSTGYLFILTSPSGILGTASVAVAGAYVVSLHKVSETQAVLYGYDSLLRKITIDISGSTITPTVTWAIAPPTTGAVAAVLLNGTAITIASGPTGYIDYWTTDGITYTDLYTDYKPSWSGATPSPYAGWGFDHAIAVKNTLVGFQQAAPFSTGVPLDAVVGAIPQDYVGNAAGVPADLLWYHTRNGVPALYQDPAQSHAGFFITPNLAWDPASGSGAAVVRYRYQDLSGSDLYDYCDISLVTFHLVDAYAVTMNLMGAVGTSRVRFS